MVHFRIIKNLLYYFNYWCMNVYIALKVMLVTIELMIFYIG